MPEDNWSLPLNQRCKHLRSKEMFYETDSNEDDMYCSGIFWCARTEKALGPDVKPASDEDCGADRDCFEQ
ncbi:MAG: hypothetical protein ACYTGQ_15870 [Planctomycetota bacterium]|jgi:hypothetical protein